MNYLEKLRGHWQKIVIAILSIFVLLLLSALFLRQSGVEREKEDIFMIEKMESTEEDGEPESDAMTEPTIIYIDIKGAVKSPGMYSFQEGDRVQDAVQRAGGLTDEADHRQINLAQKLTDQMLLIIPRVGEEGVVNQGGVSGDSDSQSDAHQVNINTADKTELMTLKGIGEVKAQSIIDYREENGSFQTIEEIKNVSGIGEGTFANLKDSITVK